MELEAPCTFTPHTLLFIFKAVGMHYNAIMHLPPTPAAPHFQIEKEYKCPNQLQIKGSGGMFHHLGNGAKTWGSRIGNTHKNMRLPPPPPAHKKALVSLCYLPKLWGERFQLMHISERKYVRWTVKSRGGKKMEKKKVQNGGRGEAKGKNSNNLSGLRSGLATETRRGLCT